jgi:hypothetical protein
MAISGKPVKEQEGKVSEFQRFATAFAFIIRNLETLKPLKPRF